MPQRTTMLQPVPYEMRMSGEQLTASVVSSADRNKHQQPLKQISFPTTKAVLWNRTPSAPSVELRLQEDKVPPRVQLVINKRTLQLAFSQLDVVPGEHYDGFCIGDLIVDNGKISIAFDRFDPGKDGHVNVADPSYVANVTEKRDIRIPTLAMDGSLTVAMNLGHGLAFMNHESTQTHSEDDFLYTMRMLEGRCSEKGKLLAHRLFSARLKCCFQVSSFIIIEQYSGQRKETALFFACLFLKISRR